MAQLRRVLTVGCPCHVAHRGNFRREVFDDDDNRSAYADLLARYSCEAQLKVVGLGFRHAGDLDRLRQAARAGRPFGTPDFIAELEQKLERALHLQKRGRKPGAEEEPEQPRKKTAGNGGQARREWVSSRLLANSDGDLNGRTWKV